MTDADILADLRAWRDEFARANGYDVGAIGAALRALDDASGSRLTRGRATPTSALAVSEGRPAPHDRRGWFSLRRAVGTARTPAPAPAA